MEKRAFYQLKRGEVELSFSFKEDEKKLENMIIFYELLQEAAVALCGDIQKIKNEIHVK